MRGHYFLQIELGNKRNPLPIGYSVERGRNYRSDRWGWGTLWNIFSATTLFRLSPSLLEEIGMISPVQYAYVPLWNRSPYRIRKKL
jgi:hypothetical protein